MSSTMFEISKDQNESPSVSDLDFKKFSGLFLVIAQEHGSGKVLMLAYVNLEALRKTQELSYSHYWLRSRNTFWEKVKVPDMFSKSLGLWWIAMKIHCFTKSVKLDQHSTLVQRVALS